MIHIKAIMMRWILIISFGLLYSSCCKDELIKGTSSAHPSFTSDVWDFSATFQDSNDDGLYLFRFNHSDPNRTLIESIEIFNIPLSEDSLEITYNSNPFTNNETQSGNFTVLIDEDAVGDRYVIDTSMNKKNYIILDCVSKSEITGKYQIFFRLDDNSHDPKFDPMIPDSFYIEEGVFSAERL